MVEVPNPKHLDSAVPEFPSSRGKSHSAPDYSKSKNPWLVKDFIKSNPDGSPNLDFKPVIGHVELDIGKLPLSKFRRIPLRTATDRVKDLFSEVLVLEIAVFGQEASKFLWWVDELLPD